MIFTALEIKYTIVVLEAFAELYPGEEVMVIGSGVSVRFWLVDRPEIWVKMEADLNFPWGTEPSDETDTLLKLIMAKAELLF